LEKAASLNLEQREYYAIAYYLMCNCTWRVHLQLPDLFFAKRKSQQETSQYKAQQKYQKPNKKVYQGNIKPIT
jgi:hypothetical protein